MALNMPQAKKQPTLDKAAGLIRGMHGKYRQDLLDHVPQMVVCGPQSSGKSAVLRRISGIRLPEDSGAFFVIAIDFKQNYFDRILDFQKFYSCTTFSFYLLQCA